MTRSEREIADRVLARIEPAKPLSDEDRRIADRVLREKYGFLTSTADPPRVTSDRLATADQRPLSARERLALVAELVAAFIKQTRSSTAVEYALIAMGLSLVGLFFAPIIGRVVADFLNAVVAGFAL